MGAQTRRPRNGARRGGMGHRPDGRIAGGGSEALAPRGGDTAAGARVRKKSRGVLREGVALKYACITRHRGEYPVRLMCRVLEVAPAGYYAWRQKASPTAHVIADERLLLNIRIAHQASDGTYGAPRVHRELREDGLHVAKKRVARLMRED